MPPKHKPAIQSSHNFDLGPTGAIRAFCYVGSSGASHYPGSKPSLHDDESLGPSRQMWCCKKDGSVTVADASHVGGLSSDSCGYSLEGDLPQVDNVVHLPRHRGAFAKCIALVTWDDDKANPQAEVWIGYSDSTIHIYRTTHPFQEEARIGNPSSLTQVMSLTVSPRTISHAPCKPSHESIPRSYSPVPFGDEDPEEDSVVATLVCAAFVDDRIAVFDARSRALLFSAPGHAGAVRSVAFLSPGCVVSGGDDGALRFWSIESQRIIGTAAMGAGHNITSLLAVPLDLEQSKALAQRVKDDIALQRLQSLRSSSKVSCAPVTSQLWAGGEDGRIRVYWLHSSHDPNDQLSAESSDALFTEAVTPRTHVASSSTIVSNLRCMIRRGPIKQLHLSLPIYSLSLTTVTDAAAPAVVCTFIGSTTMRNFSALLLSPLTALCATADRAEDLALLDEIPMLKQPSKRAAIHHGAASVYTATISMPATLFDLTISIPRLDLEVKVHQRSTGLVINPFFQRSLLSLRDAHHKLEILFLASVQLKLRWYLHALATAPPDEMLERAAAVTRQCLAQSNRLLHLKSEALGRLSHTQRRSNSFQHWRVMALEHRTRRQEMISERILLNSCTLTRRRVLRQWTEFARWSAISRSKRELARRLEVQTQKRVLGAGMLVWNRFRARVKVQNRLMRIVQSTDRGARTTYFARWRRFPLVARERRRRDNYARCLAATADNPLRHSTFNRWMNFAHHIVPKVQRRRAIEYCMGSLINRNDRFLRSTSYRRWTVFVRVRKGKRAKENSISFLVRTNDTCRQHSVFQSWKAWITKRRSQRVQRNSWAILVRLSESGILRVFFSRWRARTLLNARRCLSGAPAFAIRSLAQHSDSVLRGAYFRRWRLFADAQRNAKRPRLVAESVLRHTSRGLQLIYFRKFLRLSERRRRLSGNVTLLSAMRSLTCTSLRLSTYRKLLQHRDISKRKRLRHQATSVLARSTDQLLATVCIRKWKQYVELVTHLKRLRSQMVHGSTDRSLFSVYFGKLLRFAFSRMRQKRDQARSLLLASRTDEDETVRRNAELHDLVEQMNVKTSDSIKEGIALQRDVAIEKQRVEDRLEEELDLEDDINKLKATLKPVNTRVRNYVWTIKDPNREKQSVEVASSWHSSWGQLCSDIDAIGGTVANRALPFAQLQELMNALKEHARASLHHVQDSAAKHLAIRTEPPEQLAPQRPKLIAAETSKPRIGSKVAVRPVIGVKKR